jgi:hypothetical protein
MSTAVLISGEMRTAKQCAPSILAAFPGADFYIHAVDNENAHDAEVFNPVRVIYEPQHEMPERREYSWQMGRGCHGVQRVLKQLYGLSRVWELYERTGHKHDWIVRCRSDLVFTVAPEPEPERKPGVMIPRFCNYYGLNDRFAIMQREWAGQYFQRTLALGAYINLGGIFHPETFLAWALHSVSIQRTRAEFYTLRADGTRDEMQSKPEWGDV